MLDRTRSRACATTTTGRPCWAPGAAGAPSPGPPAATCPCWPTGTRPRCTRAAWSPGTRSASRCARGHDRWRCCWPRTAWVCGSRCSTRPPGPDVLLARLAAGPAAAGAGRRRRAGGGRAGPRPLARRAQPGAARPARRWRPTVTVGRRLPGCAPALAPGGGPVAGGLRRRRRRGDRLHLRHDQPAAGGGAHPGEPGRGHARGPRPGAAGAPGAPCWAARSSCWCPSLAGGAPVALPGPPAADRWPGRSARLGAAGHLPDAAAAAGRPGGRDPLHRAGSTADPRRSARACWRRSGAAGAEQAWGVYALTEVFPAAAVESRGEGRLRPGDGDLVGELLPGVRARVDDDGQLLLAGAERGRPLPRRAARLDWVATGDIGRLDGGRVVLGGRCKDMILRGAENIYPGLYEPALHVPGVELAVIVGVAGGRRRRAGGGRGAARRRARRRRGTRRAARAAGPDGRRPPGRGAARRRAAGRPVPQARPGGRRRLAAGELEARHERISRWSSPPTTRRRCCRGRWRRWRRSPIRTSRWWWSTTAPPTARPRWPPPSAGARGACCTEPEPGAGTAADTGFRHAIAGGATRLLRTDADCLPARDWVATARRAARRGADLVCGRSVPRRDEHPAWPSGTVSPLSSALAARYGALAASLPGVPRARSCWCTGTTWRSRRRCTCAAAAPRGRPSATAPRTSPCSTGPAGTATGRPRRAPRGASRACAGCGPGAHAARCCGTGTGDTGRTAVHVR